MYDLSYYMHMIKLSKCKIYAQIIKVFSQCDIYFGPVLLNNSCCNPFIQGIKSSLKSPRGLSESSFKQIIQSVQKLSKSSATKKSLLLYIIANDICIAYIKFVSQLTLCNSFLIYRLSIIDLYQNIFIGIFRETVTSTVMFMDVIKQCSNNIIYTIHHGYRGIRHWPIN